MSTRAARGAAIDVGTNSVRLLVADLPDSSPGAPACTSTDTRRAPVLRPVLRRLSITRLGEGFDATQMLRPEPAARTAAAVEEFAHAAEGAGAPNPVVLATYALRAARNPQELLSRIRRPVRILTGEEEARLGFFGAVAGLAPADPAPNVLVLDIGGGSVELTWGTPRNVDGSDSLPIGCVLLTRKFLAHDPPEGRETAALGQYVAEMLGPLLERFRRVPDRIIGVGGTITTMAAIDQRLDPYDPAKVHGYRLSVDRVRAILSELLGRELSARQNVPGLQPERADVIIAGALVLARVLEALGGGEIQASEADLLWAVLLGHLD